jgi:hypothetical protein
VRFHIVYNIQEMSAILGASAKTIRKYCVAQIIKAKKIGRKWHATSKALKEFVGPETEDRQADRQKTTG